MNVNEKHTVIYTNCDWDELYSVIKEDTGIEIDRSLIVNGIGTPFRIFKLENKLITVIHVNNVNMMDKDKDSADIINRNIASTDNKYSKDFKHIHLCWFGGNQFDDLYTPNNAGRSFRFNEILNKIAN